MFGAVPARYSVALDPAAIDFLIQAPGELQVGDLICLAEDRFEVRSISGLWEVDADPSQTPVLGLMPVAGSTVDWVDAIRVERA